MAIDAQAPGSRLDLERIMEFRLKRFDGITKHQTYGTAALPGQNGFFTSVMSLS